MLFERWDLSPNINEEKIVVEKIMHYINSLNITRGYYIILKNWQMLKINYYAKMIKKGKISRDDAYVYLYAGIPDMEPYFKCPFIHYFSILLDAYISKLGLYSYIDGYYYSVPANLKYVAVSIGIVGIKEYSAIEVIDLDILAKNTKIKEIISRYVHNETVDSKVYGEIIQEFKSQPLFDGYGFDEASNILHDYYSYNDTSLSKEVARIEYAYNTIFKPYKIYFNTKTQT